MNRTHGHAGRGKVSPTYSAWMAAKRRCYNRNTKDYPYYGGRGVRMSAAWFADFAQFLADMGEKPPGLTLERINNEGNYERGNCCWATRSEQALNRRQATRPADSAGINFATIRARLRRGWSVAEALTRD